MKAYGNITVSMIMQRSFIVALTGFVQHKKEILSQKLRSSADKAWRKKIGPRVEEDRKSIKICLLLSLPWSDLRVLILLYRMVIT